MSDDPENWQGYEWTAFSVTTPASRRSIRFFNKDIPPKDAITAVIRAGLLPLTLAQQ
jgi:hypothetical protein